MYSIYISYLEISLIYNIHYICRSNKKSLTRGVVSERMYKDDIKRSIISLEICCMSWLYEFLAVLSALLTPLLHEYGIPNLHMIDAIIMSIIIPFSHIMNDEDTKQVIFEENWYQGIRYLLGLHRKQVSLVNNKD